MQILNSTMAPLEVYCLKSDSEKHSVVLSSSITEPTPNAVSTDLVCIGLCDVNEKFSLPLKIAYHCKVFLRPQVDG